MKKKFIKRLEAYLDSECSDYDMTYSLEWNEDGYCCVKVKRGNYTKMLNFMYDEEKDNLLIELGEGSYYITQEFDVSVKYFWMLVSPALFPEQS